MKVWVDQEACAGDGLCEETAPSVFQLRDGLSCVRAPGGNVQVVGVMVDVPDQELDAVLDAAEQCPGECIFLEA